MNSTVYIFGNLSSGYTQYPDDYSKNIFKKLYPNAKATTQLIVHRETNCMYYTYLRKLDSEKYIGLCVLLNDLMLTRFDRVFDLFESTISKMVEKGYLIKFNNDGEVIANVEKLFLNADEVEYVAGLLKFGFDNFDDISQKLPPTDFGKQKNATQEFSIKDDAEQILTSTYSNGYTYIYKSSHYSTAQMDSYKGVLSGLHQENDNLRKNNRRLHEQNRKIIQQQKQNRNVAVLTLVIIGCGFCIYFLWENLNRAQGKIEEANQQINQKDSTINKQKERIDSLKGSFDSQQKIISMKPELEPEPQQEQKQEQMQESSYKRYKIGDGFIEVPSYLKYQGESNDGEPHFSDGETYLYVDHATGQDLNGFRSYCTDEIGNGHPEYEVVKNDWFVQSGRKWDRQIYYTKAKMDYSCNPPILYYAVLVYPKSEEKKNDIVIRKSFKNFPNLR